MVKQPSATSDSAKPSNSILHFQFRKIVYAILVLALNLHISSNAPSLLSLATIPSINPKCPPYFCVYECTHSTATPACTSQYLACCTLFKTYKPTSLHYPLTKTLGRVSVTLYVQAHQKHIRTSTQNQNPRPFQTKRRDEQCHRYMNLIIGKKFDKEDYSGNNPSIVIHTTCTN